MGGGFAKKKAKIVDAQQAINNFNFWHPSPFGVPIGDNWVLVNKHFSKTNKILTDKGELQLTGI